MLRYLVCCIFLWLLAGAVVTAARPWSSVPLNKWQEARTLDPCLESAPIAGQPEKTAAVPEPPFGDWSAKDGVLTAIGKADCWSTMLMPGDRNNVAITTRFTIQQSLGAARQMPGGWVRWGYHWGENIAGWDGGVVVGYRDPMNFYRVQFSAARGEMALWDATGGFLQLVPCALKVGQAATLTIRWNGAHLVALLDGKPVMNYWDRSLPYTHGQVGLSVWRSTMQVEQFGVTAVKDKAVMPAHTPNFHMEYQHDILRGGLGNMRVTDGYVLYDGNEPISYFWKYPAQSTGCYQNSINHDAVKLKPGARPAYWNTIGPPGMNWKFPDLVGDMPAAFTITGGGKTVSFAFQTTMINEFISDVACTVSYDEVQGVYRYVYHGKTTMLTDSKPKYGEYELFDLYPYNSRAPGPEVEYRWHPAGHKWLIYQDEQGTWVKNPLTDFPNYVRPSGDYRINNAVTQWGDITDVLYPEPGVCTTSIVHLGWEKTAGRAFSVGQCDWGYDYHHREMGGGITLPKDSVRTFDLTFTGTPREQADALFAKAKLPDYVEKSKEVLVPFVPTGGSFDKLTSWQNPSTSMIWLGGTPDATVGHTDTNSLRLDKPGRMKVRLYQYMVEAYAKRWWVRGWYKTKGVKENALQLRVAYPGYKEEGYSAQDIFALHSGDNDWTYFSYITDVFKIRDETYLGVELTGDGTVWIDDIAVSALKDGQNPPTTGTATH